MGAFPQPSNPFLQGMMNSAYLALAIKQSHLEQRAMALQEQRAQRQGQVEDLNTRMGMLQSGAQPTQASGAGPEVPNGAAVHTPGAQINGIEVGGSDQAAPRPVDPGRTVNYGGRSYYVPTPAEQFQAQLPILQAQSALKAQQAGQVAGAEAAAKAPYDQVDLPGVGKVGSKAVPFYTAQETQKAAGARQDKQIASSEKVAGMHESGANTRSAANNATSITTTKMREAGENARAAMKDENGGLTANAAGVASRFDAKLAQQEQEIHEKRLAIGNALNSQEGESYINPVTGKEENMSAARRTWLQGLMKSYDGKLATVRDQRDRVARQLTKGQPAAAAAQDKTVPVPGTATAVPAGRVRVKDSKGRIGTIPQEQLKDALASGYTQAGG